MAEDQSAAQAERVLAIKRLQQQQLMSEALEASHERDHAVERVRDWFERRRAAEEGSGVRRGIHQRPDPEAGATRAAAAARGRAAGPLTANGILSYATNVLANDPNLDTPARADGQSEPSIAVLGSNVLVAWNDGRGSIISGGPPSTLPGLMAYAYSTDGGQSFVQGGTPPSTALGGTWTSDPVITVNEKNGDFYFCGLYDPDNGGSLDEHGVAVIRGNFIGGTFAWATQPIVVKSLLESDGFIDKPWIAADSSSATGNLYLSYTRFAPLSDSIVFVRSINRGLTWGPQMTLSSTAAAGRVQGSRPAVGPGGEVYVVWKEIGPPTGNGQDFMRIVRSNDRGVSFGGEQTAAAFFDNFGTGAPGFNREQGISLPSIAVDRSPPGGAYRGRVYVAWNESVNFYDSIPDTNASPVINEVEPNDTSITAQPFTPGTAIRGSFNSTSDFDYYSFTATQGTSYVFWANELPTRYTIRIFCTDGITRLAFSGDRFNTPPNQGFIVWTCPSSGTYYMRMAIFGTTVGAYRVDTGVDILGGASQRARDSRDVFVASSSNGVSWSSPVMLSAPEPGLFDNWLPEVAVTGQGTVYALWYDWSDSPLASCGGQSQSYMARSDNGGATWASLGPVSERFVNWTFTNSNIIPNQGDYMGLFANSNAVYTCWTDGRVGTPDIWTATLPLASVQVEIVSVAADSDSVSISWRASGPYPPTANVLRATGTGLYQNVGTVTFDAGGLATFDDNTVTTSQQYRYALELLVGASLQTMGERTVFTTGAVKPQLTFVGVTPNPTLHVMFTLPDNAPADLRLYDVTGRPVVLRRFQGPGPYNFDFGKGLDLTAGIYFVKLTHGATEITRRISIVP